MPGGIHAHWAGSMLLLRAEALLTSKLDEHTGDISGANRINQEDSGGKATQSGTGSFSTTIKASDSIRAGCWGGEANSAPRIPKALVVKRASSQLEGARE
jgi:hypothetical protein